MSDQNRDRIAAMTFEDFEDLAAIHGGTLDTWPAHARQTADAVLSAKPDFARALDAERALDAALNALPMPQVSDALAARLLGDAAEISARRPESASIQTAERAPASSGGLLDWLGLSGLGLGTAGASALVAASMALGLWVGASQSDLMPLTQTQDDQLASLIDQAFGVGDTDDSFEETLL